MNYKIVKGSSYANDGDGKSAMRRHIENEEKPKKRRTGCMILLLPVVVIILYLFIKLRMH